MTSDTTKLLLALGIATGAVAIGAFVFWPKPALAQNPNAQKPQVPAHITWDYPSQAVMNTIDGALSGGAVGPGNQVNLQSGGKSVTVIVDQNKAFVLNNGAHGWNYVGHVLNSSVPGLDVGATVTFSDVNIFALLGGGDSVNATNPVQ
jgi:hypothetical protein